MNEQVRCTVTSKLLKDNPLFNECVQSLKAIILSNQEENEIRHWFNTVVPLTTWGKVDWEKIDKKIAIGYDPEMIIPALHKLIGNPVDMQVYVDWSSEGLPIIKTDVRKLIQFFDHIVCVDFEKFVMNPSLGYILEILPSNQMTLGLVKKMS